METQDYIDQIKLLLTGNILESEITDDTYKKIMDMSLKELNRYYNVTKLMTIKCPGTCIDLKDYPEINTVVNVFRPKGVGGLSDAGSSKDADSTIDPVLMSQLQMYNYGAGYYSNDWIYRYGNYSIVQQISNTMSTDLNFREDKPNKKLYITLPMGIPDTITIEYTPKLMDASEVVSDYWTNMLLRLATAYSKIAMGRIRTRYTQANAQWENDGNTILTEGNEELAAIRERLNANVDFVLPVD